MLSRVRLLLLTMLNFELDQLISYRLRREELPRISKETGLHIVAGTAFYVDPLTPENIKLMTIVEVGYKIDNKNLLHMCIDLAS